MRHIWSLAHQRRLWRRIWVALAEAQHAAGLVSAEQVDDLRAHMQDIDLARAQQIESEIHHDLMAEVRVFAEQCPVGGGIIHLGATSMDVEDNADALRLRQAIDLLLRSVRDILELLAALIDHQADHTCMAYTHLQPAEPTTVGYRLAVYAQDLLADWFALGRIRRIIRGKGFRGAVGTSASYTELLRGANLTAREMDGHIMKSLDLEAYPVSGQTYPRRQDWEILNALAGLAITLYKLAFDVRLLQSPLLGEWAEPFGRAQVGSSAMPFKRNPVNAENIDSLARLLASLPRVAWDNAAHSLLERTLDDSANRRVILPEAFLAADELLYRTHHLLEGLRIDEQGIRRNLGIYGAFAATERVLMEAVRAGGDRQEMHEILRRHSLAAWEAMQQGKPNPLAVLLQADEQITALVSPDRVSELLHAERYVGDAPERARAMAAAVREAISQAEG
jgi:adenylosuccinate lyase